MNGENWKNDKFHFSSTAFKVRMLAGRYFLDREIKEGRLEMKICR